MLAKLEAYAARLTMVVHCIRDVSDDPTLSDRNRADADSVRAGVELVRWFAHEAERVYEAITASHEAREQDGLVAWILRRGGSVTVRDLQRGLWRFRGNAELAAGALEDMVRSDLGSWHHPEPAPGGGRPMKVFVLRNGQGASTQPPPAATKTEVPSMLMPKDSAGDPNDRPPAPDRR